MPLFEVTGEELVPFRRVLAGPDLYESEIEDLMWDDMEAFTGQPLFRVARQRKTRTGGVPDIVALDANGNIHVVEVKRDIDRGQLAQGLEYAGWAKNAGLDELAGLYHDGPDAFFADWREFTDSTSPKVISRTPRLVLVARDVHHRTDDALDFLTNSDLPIVVLLVTMYEDKEGRRFIDVASDHEPEFDSTVTVVGDGAGPVHLKVDGRRVTIADLMGDELLSVGEVLEWYRPRTDTRYIATVTASGALQLADGRTFSAPSRAAIEAVGSGSYDGWHAWKNKDGLLLHELREQLLESIAQDAADKPEATPVGPVAVAGAAEPEDSDG